MNLQRFIKKLESCDDVSHRGNIIADLEALASNPRLLSDHLLGQIKANGLTQDNNLYNAYAFTLYEGQRFMLRLVFWSPVDCREEAQTFIYGLIHSHDFELFVTGYCGDGYRTIIRPIIGNGTLKEGVQPTFGAASRVTVAPGQSYHMRAFYDVHHQLPPDAFSASLSLVVYLPEGDRSEQAWCFDEHYVPQHAGLGAEELQLYNAGMGYLEALLDRQCSGRNNGASHAIAVFDCSCKGCAHRSGCPETVQ